MRSRDNGDARPKESPVERDLHVPQTKGKRISETDPIRLLGTGPVDTRDTDASIAHDRYLYGSGADNDEPEP